jgi:O-antigen/teichoic acid export membrane protein
MLSIFKGEVEVGYYNAAYRMILALLFIPTAFNVVIFPILSRQYAEPKELVSIIKKYFSIMISLGIAIAMGTTILADEFIGILYGSDYSPAVIVLQILAWSLAFTYINSPFVKLFESIDMQLLITKITGFSAAVNVLLNYLLIPKYSMVGASIATLLTEALVAISLILLSIKLGYFKLEYMKILKIIIGCLAFSAFLICQRDLNVITAIVCSILLYVGILYNFKVIDKEDISLIKSVLKLGD